MTLDAVVFWLFVLAWVVVVALLVVRAVLPAGREVRRMRRTIATLTKIDLPVAEAAADLRRLQQAVAQFPALRVRARAALGRLRRRPLIPGNAAVALRLVRALEHELAQLAAELRR